MSYPPRFRRTMPADQADGLRRLFATRAARFVPIVSNPFIVHGGVLIERICSVLEEMDLETLLVDASERGGPPRELAEFDLAEGIEALSSHVSYLAARGLPVRWVDSRGSTRAFLDAVVAAAPASQVVLVHGTAVDLVRLFGRGEGDLTGPRPVLLCDDRPESVTHAYAALKIFAQRADWRAHDLLMCTAPGGARAEMVASRLAYCADHFLGGVQHAFVQVDPTEPPTAAPSRSMVLLVEGLLESAAAFTAGLSAGEATSFAGSPGAALPSPRPAHL